MNHTPESLLALKESPEGLEQLRIIAAEFDGWELHWKGDHGLESEWVKESNNVRSFLYESDLPNYPTSLDAIFAAEERLGLHDKQRLKIVWLSYAKATFGYLGRCFPTYEDFAFLPPPIRLIPFILTAQWKEQNQ